MMKKRIRTILIWLLLLACLAGCTGKGNDPATPTGEQETTTGTTPEAPGTTVTIFDQELKCRIIYEDSSNHIAKALAAVQSKLAIKFNLTVSKIPSIKASQYKPSEGCVDIFLGNTGIPVGRQLAMNEYACYSDGKNIIVSSPIDAGVEKAADLLLVKIQKAKFKDKVCEVDMTEQKGTLDSFYVDYPEFEGWRDLTLMDCGSGELLSCIKKVPPQTFDGYRQTLLGAGFSLYEENEIGNTKSATYCKDGNMVHTYFIADKKSTGTVRIVTQKNAVLPDKDVPSYTKLTTSSLTQTTNAYPSSSEEGALCLIFRLDDGSFIVVDGGYEGNGARIYNTLQSLNVREDGIVIAAWIITHDHSDHVYAFQRFARDYGKDVTLERLMFNVCPALYQYHMKHVPYAGGYGKFSDYLGSQDFYLDVKRFKNTPVCITPHTGQYLNVRNARIDFLYSSEEDLFPKDLQNDNDSSVVFRVTVEGVTTLVLGDAAEATGTLLDTMYGDALKSDIMQLAHHGYAGIFGGAVIYPRIDPQVLIWPAGANCYARDSAGNSTDISVLSQLKKKAHYAVIIADKNRTIALPYDPDNIIVTESDL